jgi:hypothetical protein
LKAEPAREGPCEYMASVHGDGDDWAVRKIVKTPPLRCSFSFGYRCTAGRTTH